MAKRNYKWHRIEDFALDTALQRLSDEGCFDEQVSDSSLKFLGNRLEIGNEDRAQNNSYVYALTDTIQQEFHVARFYVSGSYGRRAAIGLVNIDLVVFLQSKHLPPYEKEPDNLLGRLHAVLLKEFSSDPKFTILPTVQNLKALDAPYVAVHVGNARIRVYLAPSLGQNSEEQRQAAYRCMQNVYSTGGLEAVAAWHPCLIERPSEEMARANFQIQSFVRLCSLWANLLNAKSLRQYAIETLAFIVAKKQSLASSSVSSSTAPDQEGMNYRSQDDEYDNDILDFSGFNFLNTFEQFLNYCSDLTKVATICEIESPASYVSPWSLLSSSSNNGKASNNCLYLLTDNFNPYDNLLSTLTVADAEHIHHVAQMTLQKLQESHKINMSLEELFLQNKDMGSSDSWISQNKKHSSNILFFIAFASAFIVLLVAIYFGFRIYKSDELEMVVMWEDVKYWFFNVVIRKLMAT